MNTVDKPIRQHSVNWWALLQLRFRLWRYEHIVPLQNRLYHYCRSLCVNPLGRQGRRRKIFLWIWRQVFWLYHRNQPVLQYVTFIAPVDFRGDYVPEEELREEAEAVARFHGGRVVKAEPLRHHFNIEELVDEYAMIFTIERVGPNWWAEERERKWKEAAANLDAADIPTEGRILWPLHDGGQEGKTNPAP